MNVSQVLTGYPRISLDGVDVALTTLTEREYNRRVVTFEVYAF